MSKTRFFTFLFMINLLFVFVKIYQHNLFIKLSYEKQRIENKKNNLRKKKNELLVQFFRLKDQAEVKKVAQEKWGMKPLKLSQITTLTTKVYNKYD